MAGVLYTRHRTAKQSRLYRLLVDESLQDKGIRQQSLQALMTHYAGGDICPARFVIKCRVDNRGQ